MRNRCRKISGILHLTGLLLNMLAVVVLVPLAVVLIYWGKNGDGWITVRAFLVPALLAGVAGPVLQKVCKKADIGTSGAMLFCAVAWLVASALGALPFMLGINAAYLDGYFEAMSGFTTTGITVFSGLEQMPRSIIFWRAFTQWLGGIGILSFFLAVTFRGTGAHHILGAESHKISSRRPAPGLMNTVRILWGIYGLFTALSILLLTLVGMSFFDSMCHSFTALSTGGFSPYDASIDYYRTAAFVNYRLIEYVLVFSMMLGGINFLIHFRALSRDFSALWDNVEIRYWWGFIAGFTGLIMIDHFLGAGQTVVGIPRTGLARLEEVFRYTIFQVVSIMTTTGFGTRDIGSPYFPALSKQLFLLMMVIGGCIGSTGGGIKVLRVAVLNRMMLRELTRLRLPHRAETALVVDGQPVPDDEIHRIGALFFAWMVLLAIGGGITAVLSQLDPLAAWSGMFSALGNIGPCYISVGQMIEIHPVVKVTYIVGMLAGRLELLPVLLLFSRKAWR